MAYSELIKNFSKIRSYMREFYVYGFKSREEYTQKSSRSYDDERRRVESWLNEYMQFHQDKEGKQVFLSIDSRQIVHNPVYQAWKAKSFTPGDITLHFYLMVILSQQSRLSLSEIMDELDEILQHFPNSRLFDESTVRKKLKEYVAEGLVLQQKQGRKMYYTLAPIDSLPQTDFLDLFATIGALRHADEEEIISRFVRAYAENADLAMKILFFARDVHEGLGECRAFRTILHRLAFTHPDSVKKNISLIAQYGRFDDLLTCLDTPCEEAALTYLFEQFQADQQRLANGEAISLLAKWLPSINASNAQTVKQAKKVARYFRLSDKEYRQNLSAMRKSLQLIENHLRVQNYTFDYAKQPSRALFKYREAFLRNDQSRYQSYLDQVKMGQKKMNTRQVMPYEVVQQGLDLLGPRYYYGVGAPEGSIDVAQKELLNIIWEQLPTVETKEDTLAVIDTSGSMYFDCQNPIPASVAFSLGLYFAQHNQGAFRHHFIEFSSRPQLVEIKGQTFMDRLEYLTTFDEVANTNLEGVFDLILHTALEHKLPQTALPAKLLIISDMEFDACVDNHEVTNFEQAKQKFASFGYTLPKIVFWNVASRHNQQPVTQNEAGVYLVSGVTPKIFELVVSDALNPYQFMLEVVESPRYQQITA